MILPILVGIEIAIVVSAIVFLILSLRPKNTFARIDELESQGEYQKVLMALLKMFRKHPNDPDVIWRLAQVNEKLGNTLEAIGYLLKLLEINRFPLKVTETEVERQLGLLYFQVGNFQESFKHLYKAYKKGDRDRRGVYYLGLMCASLGRYAFAENFLQKVRLFYKKNAEYYKNLAMIQIQQRKFGEALENIEQGYMLAKTNPSVILVLAYTLAKLRGYKRAVEVLEGALKDKIHFEPIQLLLLFKILGYSYVNLAEYNLAVEAFRNLAKLSTDLARPKDEREGYFSILMSYIKGKMYDKALSVIPELKTKKIEEVIVSSIEEALIKAMEYKEKSNKSEIKQDISEIKELSKIVDEWLAQSLPIEEIWNVEGIKLDIKEPFDPVKLMNSIDATIAPTPSELGEGIKGSVKEEMDPEEVCNMLVSSFDYNTFVDICKLLVSRLGYKIEMQLETDIISFIEGEGVDFLARPTLKEGKIFIAIRRWKGGQVGRIAMMDLVQRAHEKGAEKLVFITTSELTEEAQKFVEARKDFIEVIYCKDIAEIIAEILSGLTQPV